jgi:hypothetical protein
MHIGDKEVFKYPEGKENIRASFKQRWPKHHTKIDTYFDHINRAFKAFK